MDDYSEPTAIVSALKDLKRFLKAGTSATGSRENFGSYMATRDQYCTNPKLKLSFNDTTMINDDSDEFDDNDIGASYVNKQRENIAGFDIAKKIREKDVEVIDAKNKISVLESKLSCAEVLNEKAKVEYESELHGLRKKQMRDMELISDLRHQVKVLSDRKQDVKNDALTSRKAAEDSYAALEEKYNSLRAQEMEKADKLKQELSKLRSECVAMQNQMSESQSSMQFLKSENNRLEKQTLSDRDKLKDMDKLLLQVDETKVQLIMEQTKTKELQCRLSELENYENHQRSFENSLQQVPLLEKELAKVKDDNLVHKITAVNTGLLEEKVNSANSQIRLLENRCSELTEENAHLSTLRKFSEQFEEVIKDEFELAYMPPVSELVQRLKEIRKGDKELSRSIEQLKQSLKSHEKTKHHQDIRISKLNNELSLNQKRSAKMEDMVKRLQRKLVLMSKERDHLRELIDSYKTETFLAPSGADQRMVETLEAELKAYKEENSRLEADIQAVTKDSDGENPLERVKFLEKKVAGMEENIQALKDDKEKIELQLGYHINKGGFDEAKTRVLQFMDNPMAKACSSLDENVESLRVENEGLKKRIKLMEEGDQFNLTQKVGMKVKESKEQNFKELQDKCDLVELQNKRLIEAFKEKSTEMREVVYRLTGYRVDVKNDSRYKILNMYSDSPDDYLLFEQTPTGEIELLETDFSSTLESLIDLHLTEQNSFPCFLSALTLDLFARNTLCDSVTLQSTQKENDHAQNRDYMSDDDAQGGDIGSGTEYVEQESEASNPGSEEESGHASSSSSVSRIRSENSDREANSDEERGENSDEERGENSDDEGGKNSDEERDEEDGEIGEGEEEEEEEVGDGGYEEGMEEGEEEYEEEYEDEENQRPYKRRRHNESEDNDNDDDEDDDDLICLD